VSLDEIRQECLKMKEGDTKEFESDREIMRWEIAVLKAQVNIDRNDKFAVFLLRSWVKVKAYCYCPHEAR